MNVLCHQFNRNKVEKFESIYHDPPPIRRACVRSRLSKLTKWNGWIYHFFYHRIIIFSINMYIIYRNIELYVCKGCLWILFLFWLGGKSKDVLQITKVYPLSMYAQFWNWYEIFIPKDGLICTKISDHNTPCTILSIEILFRGESLCVFYGDLMFVEQLRRFLWGSFVICFACFKHVRFRIHLYISRQRCHHVTNSKRAANGSAAW